MNDALRIADGLAAPFPAKDVHWRAGATTGDGAKCMPLAYIDARDVMERLDDVCGPGGWQSKYPWNQASKLCCEIGIKIGGEWLWKSNGAGDTAYEADKGAFSDAFKRAAVCWGVGRYLYYVPNVWVPCEKRGKTVVISDSVQKNLSDRLQKWQDQRVGVNSEAKAHANELTLMLSGKYDPDTIMGYLDAIPDRIEPAVMGLLDGADKKTILTLIATRGSK